MSGAQAAPPPTGGPILPAAPLSVGARVPVRRVVCWLLGLLAALALAFVISPFDATVRGDIGIRVLEATLRAVPTGLGVAAATMVIDGGCAFLVGLGLWANPSASKKLDLVTSRVLNPKRRKKSPKKVQRSGRQPSSGWAAQTATDLSLAVGVGAGAVLLKYPTASPAKWFRLGVTYTFVNTVLLGFVGYLVAGGANWMADLGFGWLRQGVIRWVPDPVVWTAIFVVTVLAPFAYGEWLDRRGLADTEQGVQRF